MDDRRAPCKALVLAGGGARGSYQVGVWRALMELDWHPQIITGTSVGSLNGAMFVLDQYETARDDTRRARMRPAAGQDEGCRPLPRWKPRKMLVWTWPITTPPILCAMHSLQSAIRHGCRACTAV